MQTQPPLAVRRRFAPEPILFEEPGEALEDTALREANEEIGLQYGVANVLGELSPLFIGPSNFCVHPFVAVSETEPQLAPLEEEVAAILHVPVASLFDPESVAVERWSLQGQMVDIPCIRFHHYKIWGATAMMLSELRAVLEPGEEDDIGYALAVDSREHGVYDTPEEAADVLLKLAKESNLQPSITLLFEEDEVI